MKIVIEIPEDAYRQIRNWGVPTDKLRRKIYDIIDNGIPLPEHHGRLIDCECVVDAIDDWIDAGEYGYTNATDYLRTRFKDIPTIIEGSDSE